MPASFTPPFQIAPARNWRSPPWARETYRGQPTAPPKHALKSIDIEVARGCIFGLLGPNGAGKSTFINILAGTVIKSAGQVSVWGSDLDKSPRQLRANIGIVPQELNIDVYFTPRELLEFTAGMYGVPKSQRRTDALLALMGLTDKAGAYSRTCQGDAPTFASCQSYGASTAGSGAGRAYRRGGCGTAPAPVGYGQRAE